MAVKGFVDIDNRELPVEENGFKKPLAGQGPVARPSLSRSGGLIKTWVQKTGCGTVNTKLQSKDN